MYGTSERESWDSIAGEPFSPNGILRLGSSVPALIDLSDGLHVTQEAIDIVGPGGNGTADQSHIILTPDSDGRLGQVWIDTSKTDNPSAIKVDTSTSTKPQ
jgi:hypothetical protein